jgi:TRAP-type C4-dicarboxylate transport system permease small subunit
MVNETSASLLNARFLLGIDNAIAKAEMAVASTALAMGLMVSFYTIVTRTLLVPTAEWVLELPMELLVVAAIYGSGALISQDRHLSVGLVVRRLPEGWRCAVSLVVRLILALLSVFLAERCWTAAAQAVRAGLHIPELFNLPSAVPLRIAAGGFALWSLHYGLSLLAGKSEAGEEPAEADRET